MEKIFKSAQLLCQLPTVSGNEQEGFPALLDFCGGKFDEVKTTPVGSFIGIKRCGKKNAKMLLLDAHIDEIGFIVSNVFDDGFVSVARWAASTPVCFRQARSQYTDAKMFTASLYPSRLIFRCREKKKRK